MADTLSYMLGDMSFREVDQTIPRCIYCDKGWNVNQSACSVACCEGDCGDCGDCGYVYVCDDGCLQVLQCGHESLVPLWKVNGEPLFVACLICGMNTVYYPDNSPLTVPLDYQWQYRWDGESVYGVAAM